MTLQGLEHADSPKLEGVFWLPENEELRWPGVVQILDGGITRITLWQLGERERVFSFYRPISLHGELDEIGRRHITIEDCRLRLGPTMPRHLGGSVVLESDLSIFWLHLDSHPAAESIVATDFWFLLEGVEGWLGPRLWDIENGEHGLSYRAKEPAEIAGVRVEEGVHASIRVSTRYDVFAPGLKVDTSGEVELNSRSPLSVRRFARLAERLQKFMCFALGRQCLITEMCIAQDGRPAASICCPTWLSGFPSGKVDKRLPSGSFFMARDVGPETTPAEALEKWCHLCSNAEDVVESIVRVLADSRSTDRRADLVVPALEKLADNVSVEEPDSMTRDRRRMIRAVADSEHLSLWKDKLRWNPNPLRKRLDGIFRKYIGDRITADKRCRVIGELVDFRNRRFHRGFYEISDDAWFHATAVLYFCILDKLGMDWRPLMTESGTLAERYR